MLWGFELWVSGLLGFRVYWDLGFQFGFGVCLDLVFGLRGSGFQDVKGLGLRGLR